ncbi:hypothetical protein F2Q70_00014417 [Brassica cretica]|uniref:Uncharacterized protein n=1 Tax=Brassica cretica TaxID=69181 RepID=A0A8S9HXU8_BRACR|nr:hypothetical protein F2Q70_00014417 [Brassica cretica]KAF2598784.1 hypothetical protein F2Q68_00007425 [Brassica cretica]
MNILVGRLVPEILWISFKLSPPNQPSVVWSSLRVLIFSSYLPEEVGGWLVGVGHGFSVEKVEYKSVMITVWDVDGHEKLKPLWRHYFNNTDGLVT